MINKKTILLFGIILLIFTRCEKEDIYYYLDYNEKQFFPFEKGDTVLVFENADTIYYYVKYVEIDHENCHGAIPICSNKYFEERSSTITLINNGLIDSNDYFHLFLEKLLKEFKFTFYIQYLNFSDYFHSKIDQEEQEKIEFVKNHVIRDTKYDTLYKVNYKDPGSGIVNKGYYVLSSKKHAIMNVINKDEGLDLVIKAK